MGRRAKAEQLVRPQGLSTDYWIKDESSKECFDCQMLFTAFRRKHHCEWNLVAKLGGPC